ncbi:ras-related and estrogen-regulated growth inhibitor-like [Scleropages formosus]|uniref:small monomeric GTPase n=1 Tax=Scleropages formosus TaxID=113540 RepID=A0A0P7VHM8_SCLFO|nr:ras-related and estrogen-regulated growth inhibitor-like [Scleropages formosus]
MQSTYRHQANVDDEVVNMDILDTAGQADLEHARQVSTEEGERLAAEMACAFYECSACTGEGAVSEAFYELCREVRRRRMVQGKARRRSSTTHNPRHLASGPDVRSFQRLKTHD